MKVCVYLSYIGLGANLLHLSYVHQLSEKFGPITVLRYAIICWMH